MLIAGLSAWTYENDRDTFYSSLVSPEAVLSTYGESAMKMALSIAEDREMRNDSPI